MEEFQEYLTLDNHPHEGKFQLSETNQSYQGINTPLNPIEQEMNDQNKSSVNFQKKVVSQSQSGITFLQSTCSTDNYQETKEGYDQNKIANNKQHSKKIQSLNSNVPNDLFFDNFQYQEDENDEGKDAALFMEDNEYMINKNENQCSQNIKAITVSPELTIEHQISDDSNQKNKILVCIQQNFKYFECLKQEDQLFSSNSTFKENSICFLNPSIKYPVGRGTEFAFSSKIIIFEGLKDKKTKIEKCNKVYLIQKQSQRTDEAKNLIYEVSIYKKPKMKNVMVTEITLNGKSILSSIFLSVNFFLILNTLCFREREWNLGELVCFKDLRLTIPLLLSSDKKHDIYCKVLFGKNSEFEERLRNDDNNFKIQEENRDFQDHCCYYTQEFYEEDKPYLSDIRVENLIKDFPEVRNLFLNGFSAEDSVDLQSFVARDIGVTEYEILQDKEGSVHISDYEEPALFEEPTLFEEEFNDIFGIYET